jgi:hypothetical protein
MRLNKKNFAQDGLNYLLSIHLLDNIMTPLLNQEEEADQLLNHTTLEDLLLIQLNIKIGPLMQLKKDSLILDTCTLANSEFTEKVELALIHF